MRRREFITLLGGAASWPLAARAQQPTPVIGYLSSAPREREDDLRAFRQGLKDNGFVAGENVVIDSRFGGIQMERVPELLDELVRRRVAVIVVNSGPIALLAAKVSTTIPIVFLVPEDPVRLGLVASLARPGGNMTGINFFVAELASKRLELLRTLLPTAKRVAVLLNPAEPSIAAANRRDVEAAAGTMGLQIRVLNASTSAEIDAAFAVIAHERPDGLFISSGPFFGNRRVQLAHLATRHAIPAIASGGATYPEVGGLMGYGTNSADRYRQAGVYVGRILKGAKPADLPVVQSTKFEFVINHQTARTIGIEVPPTLLAIADEVIE
jgi:putative tryptophan/tyrosine transport system substrate-binding protein